MHLSDTHNGLRAFNRTVAGNLDTHVNGTAHASEFVPVATNAEFRHTETPVHLIHLDYSKANGQALLNSVNIVFQLLFG